VGGVDVFGLPGLDQGGEAVHRGEEAVVTWVGAGVPMRLTMRWFYSCFWGVREGSYGWVLCFSRG
jgi:hypothetical protein